MCTATWMATEGRFRLYFNRDELRSRGPARPPERLEREGTAILAPIDGDRGGSWIAANEHGLVACLLNGYVEESDPAAAAPEKLSNPSITKPRVPSIQSATFASAGNESA